MDFHPAEWKPAFSFAYYLEIRPKKLSTLEMSELFKRSKAVIIYYQLNIEHTNTDQWFAASFCIISFGREHSVVFSLLYCTQVDAANWHTGMHRETL